MGVCLVHLEIFIRSGRCQGAFGVSGKHDYYESDKKLPCWGDPKLKTFESLAGNAEEEEDDDDDDEVVSELSFGNEGKIKRKAKQEAVVGAGESSCAWKTKSWLWGKCHLPPRLQKSSTREKPKQSKKKQAHWLQFCR